MSKIFKVSFAPHVADVAATRAHALSRIEDAKQAGIDDQLLYYARLGVQAHCDDCLAVLPAHLRNGEAVFFNTAEQVEAYGTVVRTSMVTIEEIELS